MLFLSPANKLIFGDGVRLLRPPRTPKTEVVFSSPWAMLTISSWTMLKIYFYSIPKCPQGQYTFLKVHTGEHIWGSVNLYLLWMSGRAPTLDQNLSETVEAIISTFVPSVQVICLCPRRSHACCHFLLMFWGLSPPLLTEGINFCQSSTTSNYKWGLLGLNAVPNHPTKTLHTESWHIKEKARSYQLFSLIISQSANSIYVLLFNSKWVIGKL